MKARNGNDRLLLLSINIANQKLLQMQADKAKVQPNKMRHTLRELATARRTRYAITRNSFIARGRALQAIRQLNPLDVAWRA